MKRKLAISLLSIFLIPSLVLAAPNVGYVSSGGGLTESAADALYLKTDGSNAGSKVDVNDLDVNGALIVSDEATFVTTIEGEDANLDGNLTVGTNGLVVNPKSPSIGVFTAEAQSSFHIYGDRVLTVGFGFPFSAVFLDIAADSGAGTASLNTGFGTLKLQDTSGDGVTICEGGGSTNIAGNMPS